MKLRTKFRKNLSSKINGLLSHWRLIGLLFKEFKLLVRRKKTPLLVLSLPVLLLIIYTAGSNAVANPQTIISVGVCNNDELASEFLNSVTSNFRITELSSDDCIASLKDKVRSGEFIIGMVIPNGFINSLSNAEQGGVTYYVDDSSPLTASMSHYFLEQAFSDYSRQVISSTEQELKEATSGALNQLDNALLILNTTRSVVSDNQVILGLTYSLIDSYLDSMTDELNHYRDELLFAQSLSVEFLTKPVVFNKGVVYSGVNAASFNFASIFCIVSIFTLLLLASTSIIFDKKTNYLLRIKATKTFIPTYLLSKIIFYLTISAAQFLLVMLLMFFQGAVFNFNFWSLIASFVIISILNTSIGLLIGSLSESENVAILFSLTLSLPFLFLSGAFFPLEFMPDYVQWLSNIIPLHTEILLLKQSSVLGWGLSMIEPLIIQLLSISLVLLGLNYALLKFRD